MEISHVISDAILFIVGIFVFFRYLLHLDLMETLLWESFTLSVAAAALFGTFRFAGVEDADSMSAFFQVMAATVGALGLATAAWYAALGKTPDRIIVFGIIGLGFLLFALEEILDVAQVSNYIPLITIPLVLLAGIYALSKKRSQLGTWLIAGVVFAALATFRGHFVENPDNAIDAYHYLLALSLLSFGIAAGNSNSVKA